MRWSRLREFPLQSSEAVFEACLKGWELATLKRTRLFMFVQIDEVVLNPMNPYHLPDWLMARITCSEVSESLRQITDAVFTEMKRLEDKPIPVEVPG